VSLTQDQRCRWLVVGSGGMLGRDLVAALEGAGEEVFGRTHRQLDLTDEAATHAALREYHPDVVVNCAAWTAVDDAEAHENEALAVNGHGAAHLAAACAAGPGGPSGPVRLVHMSTDYVFGGDASRPYAEHDAVGPRTAYGRTKLAGEQAVLRLLPRSGYVVRTAWLYGAHGPNFVSTMIRLERERPAVDVVTDQRGQPTWTADVAGQIIALVRSPTAAAGIYHATSSGEATWFDLAREVFRLLGADPARVHETTSSAYPRPAPRPGYSVLGHDGWAPAGIEPIGDWRLALGRALPGLLPPEDPRSCTPPVQVGLTRYVR
jgi:dTDP-4-dehydrorhamnose reductase